MEFERAVIKGGSIQGLTLPKSESIPEVKGSVILRQGNIQKALGNGKATTLPIQSSGLFHFVSHRFTNANAEGNIGPTPDQLLEAYSEEVWSQNVNLFSSHQGIQIWTVPADGLYKITVAGASGGGVASRGAKLRGNFQLLTGMKLHILVGQKGERASSFEDVSGGGGSFVVLDGATPLIIAGGGGGSMTLDFASFSYGLATERGGNGFSSTVSNHNGKGGSNGNGGLAHNRNTTQAGAGFITNGEGNGSPASSFLNGGLGGINRYGVGNGAVGGFGGGGGANRASGSYIGIGGGGGYSGGGSSYVTGVKGASAGGGGSFNAGIDPFNAAGINESHGYVTITKL